VTDNLGREAVVLIAIGRWCVHTTSMSHAAAAEQVDNALKRCQCVPRVIITDKLQIYGAAKRELFPSVEHRQHRM
jgi:transposase-like protein